MNNKNPFKFNKTQVMKVLKKIEYYFDMIYRIVKGIFGYLVIVLLIVGTLGAGAVLGYFSSLVEGTPTLTQAEMDTKLNDYETKSTLFYANNSKISDLRSDLLRTPISLDEVSPWIISSLIATEDENFYDHVGIVPKALIRAGLQEVSGATSVTGGSTLTQQLIKQQILTSDVTHSRKAIEILYATHLENSFDKKEILETYLNVSPFGRNNYGRNIAGIEEAAQGIFGVSAADVNLPQAAFLAGLPKSPIAYSPYTQSGELKEDFSAGISRQKDVLFNLRREGYIDQEMYEVARDFDISENFLKKSDDDTNDASHSFVYDAVEKTHVIF